MEGRVDRRMEISTISTAKKAAGDENIRAIYMKIP